MKLRCVVIALALLAAFASDSWGQSQRKAPPREETKTTQQPAASDQRGTEQSPAIVKIIPTPKTAEETESDRKEREDKNKSDWWLVKLTGALALIGFLQLIVFGWQGVQLKRTVSVTQAAIELSNKEFIAAHRPQIRVKHVWFTDQTAWRLNGPLEVNLDLVNIGNASARVTWINYQSILIPAGKSLPQRPPYDEVWQSDIRISRFQTNADLASGITLARTVCDGILDDQQVHDILWGQQQLYLIGSIEYWDLAGLRQTAFCRRLTFESYPPATGDLGRFKIVEDPDYEYED